MEKEQLKQLQDRILKLFDEAMKQAKTQFETGKVYKLPNSTFMVYLTEHNGMDRNKGYGFNGYGVWYFWGKEDYGFGLYDCVEATPSEWQEALKKEAMKRGFKEGVKCQWDGDIIEVKTPFKLTYLGLETTEGYLIKRDTYKDYRYGGR